MRFLRRMCMQEEQGGQTDLQDHNKSCRCVPSVIVVQRLVVGSVCSCAQGNLLIIM